MPSPSSFFLDGDLDGNRFRAELDGEYVMFYNILVERPDNPDPSKRFKRRDLARMKVNRLFALSDAVKAQMEKDKREEGKGA